ncbi:MAG: hypothetical protein NT053_06145 [Cyanobacteria bacterium]|nr:hypothetical protein [Cyanobacteriota bacterium]
MSARTSNLPPLSLREAWLSDGRQVLHFRPSRWERWSHPSGRQLVEIEQGEESFAADAIHEDEK